MYKYSSENVLDSKVALIAGGGNEADVYPMLKDKRINTYLTGIAKLRESFQPSVDAQNSVKNCNVIFCLKLIIQLKNLHV